MDISSQDNKSKLNEVLPSNTKNVAQDDEVNKKNDSQLITKGRKKLMTFSKNNQLQLANSQTYEVDTAR